MDPEATRMAALAALGTFGDERARHALETALFIDAGNVWVDPLRLNPFSLRYAGGSGIRVATPVGPIALDYGVNLNRRAWEDFGAFHFSIGLF